MEWPKAMYRGNSKGGVVSKYGALGRSAGGGDRGETGEHNAAVPGLVKVYTAAAMAVVAPLYKIFPKFSMWLYSPNNGLQYPH
jgi:hypothetical protein